ncbi:hypothetical protein [Pedobacter sp. L105]|uniref:hypothetical protein n=1 Tax=Pedobacter sp. L105 TaxID=1641871 RepID=UPI00131C0433|nr:hypothetical protein [Pedobacter sp. L105]
MINNKISYGCQTYDPKKGFIYVFPCFILLAEFVIVLGKYFESDTFVVGGWIFVCAVPFLFQKKFKSIFTRRVELEFNNQSFLIEEYKLKDDVLVKELNISWSDIKFYKCSFSTSKITYLVVFFKDGSSKSFSFIDEKNQDQAINEKSGFSLFFYFVNQYNLDHQSEEGISLKPIFLQRSQAGFF